jgi:hypothetical protein
MPPERTLPPGARCTAVGRAGKRNDDEGVLSEAGVEPANLQQVDPPEPLVARVSGRIDAPVRDTPPGGIAARCGSAVGAVRTGRGSRAGAPLVRSPPRVSKRREGARADVHTFPLSFSPASPRTPRRVGIRLVGRRAREESNLRHADSKSAALSPELRAPAAHPIGRYGSSDLLPASFRGSGGSIPLLNGACCEG